MKFGPLCFISGPDDVGPPLLFIRHDLYDLIRTGRERTPPQGLVTAAEDDDRSKVERHQEGITEIAILTYPGRVERLQGSPEGFHQDWLTDHS